MTAILGIDIGGTFTDFVLLQEGAISIHKRLSTPDDPSRSLLAGIEEIALADDADVVHGSTVATNALLERRGACTALITTEGFADMIEIGRQNRPDLYALVPQKPPPLIPSERRLEVRERISGQGEVLIPLNPEDLPALAERLEALEVESVAVSLLFSFLYPRHEQMIAEALRDRFVISLSSEVLPEYREYERTSTTAINAYVAPIMARYLERIEKGIGGRRLRIMQSNGGVITAATARMEAVRTALSGPAGGVVGAFHAAQMAGFDHVITFDMGGTSTDVALCPGEIVHTSAAHVGGMPLRLPMVDIHTVGAGGGSLARVDEGGALVVGPESAGADPGPACYGRGEEPTVTDANLLLGRLHPDHFLGGRMRLYPERAVSAFERLAGAMAVREPEEAAWGVVAVADATMVRAIRAISVERGYDPRIFTLVAFGGAGPLHACALAEALSIPRVLSPRAPGVLSALGMVLADLVKDYSRTVMLAQSALEAGELTAAFESIEARARQDLLNEGIPEGAMTITRALDVRYVGQSHELTVFEPDDGRWAAAFHAAHERRYGYNQPEEPIEIVNIRIKAIGRGPKPAFERLPEGGSEPTAAFLGEAPAWFALDAPQPTALYARERLEDGNRLTGPAVIFQLDATTVIPPGWHGVVDRWGNLILERK